MRQHSIIQWLKWVAGLLISAVTMYFLFKRVNMADIFVALSQSSAPHLVLGGILFLVSLLCRSVRIRVLLNKKHSFHNVFAIASIHNMMNNLLPARTGELIYPYLLKQKGIAMGTGISTLLILRVFDTFFICLAFLIALLFLNNIPSELLNGLPLVAVLIIVILIIVLLLFLLQRPVMSLLLRIPTTNRASLKILKLLRTLVEGFYFIKQRDIFLKTAIYSALIWIANYGMGFAILKGLQVPIDLVPTIVAMTFVLVISTLPIYSVAGLGIIEGTLSFALSLFGIEQTLAISSAFSFHIIQLIYVILGGLAGVLLWCAPLFNKSKINRE